MDEQTDKKINELKRNPPNRTIPLVLLLLAVGGVFVWRVASTDPKWNAADASAPKAVQTAPAKTAAPAKAAKPATPKAAPAPAKSAAAEKAQPAPQAAAPAKAKATEPAVSEPAPAAEPAPAPTASLDNYLTAHKGEMVPFTHRGQQRTVKLVDFTDDTVTIQVKTKSLTLKRSALTPEQLELWK